MTLNDLAQGALVPVLALIGGAIGGYLSGYLKQKGANQATKEDISTITDQIESIRSTYTAQSTQLQSSLNLIASNHGFRYRQEYKILSELSAAIVELRDASMSISPIMDIRDPNMTDDEILTERMTRARKASLAVYKTIETHSPFLPQTVYDGTRQLRDTASKIAHVCHRGARTGMDEDYWDDIEQFSEQLAEHAESALQLIRQRIECWDEPIEQFNASNSTT